MTSITVHAYGPGSDNQAPIRFFTIEHDIDTEQMTLSSGEHVVVIDDEGWPEVAAGMLATTLTQWQNDDALPWLLGRPDLRHLLLSVNDTPAYRLIVDGIVVASHLDLLTIEELDLGELETRIALLRDGGAFQMTEHDSLHVLSDAFVGTAAENTATSPPLRAAAIRHLIESRRLSRLEVAIDNGALTMGAFLLRRPHLRGGMIDQMPEHARALWERIKDHVANIARG